MATQKVVHTNMLVKGNKIPVKVYHEWRNNVRASIGKKTVILRFPVMMTKNERTKQMEWFQHWVAEQFEKNEKLGARFFGKGYKDGDVLKVGERQYLLKIAVSENQSHSARLRNSVIQLKLVEDDSEINRRKSIKHLLSRVVAKDFLPEIQRRVNELNQLFFQQSVKSVRLKYNQSNWGSCSSRGNVNLSTRLLFAPEEVIDYVIIHELAHFIEMNHSQRFWKLVSSAMPDYKLKEAWLKKNGHLCDF